LSTSPDAEIAVAELAAQLVQPDTSVVIVFCSCEYDLERLGPAIAAAFPSIPVVGCTSSGQLGPTGFQLGGITGVSLASRDLRVTPHVIAPLAQAVHLAGELAGSIDSRPHLSAGWRSFGLVLVDGLSMAEERLVAALYARLPDVPIIGGSAGDDLRFERTHVYVDGRFVTDTAVFALFDTSLPFTTFRFQHFVPTDRCLVITDAAPDQRIVREIDGEPAAEGYAHALGLTVDALTPDVFSQHPILVNIGGEHYVRSIQKANADGSMTFYCAIEDGLVVRVGRGVDIQETARAALVAARTQVGATAGAPGFILGCDCILRRLEFQGASCDQVVGDLYAEHGVLGFSTYGEQYNGVHVNQTFTGVALGGVR
jgi:hypothetical protein